MMSDVTIRGRKAEVQLADSQEFWIECPDEPVSLYRDCEWRNAESFGYITDYWPTREAAEQFLREHADPSAKEGSEILGSGGAGRAALAEMRQQDVTVNNPLAVLTQEQAVRVAEVVASGEPSLELAMYRRNWIDLCDALMGVRRKVAEKDAELTALRSQLAGVQGALADAGDVLAIRTDGDYGASVREVVEQRDAAREQVADAGARWNASLDALIQCQEQLAEVRFKLTQAERALADMNDKWARTRGEVTRLEQERDAAREDVAHLALLRNDMLKDITARDEQVTRLEAIIGDCDFLAWDNCDPPQLWAWRGERDESAEPGHRITNAKDSVAALTARDEEVRRLRSALNDLAIQPEYDCPGDTPEICGYLCLICRGLGSTEGDVEHKPDCDLASPPPPRTITPLPRIVCLCGSTRFYKAFQEANYRETMAGRIVLSVGFYPHAETEAHGEERGCTPEQKEALDVLHKRKIDLADEVLVLNVGGYIGSSTRGEIEHATKTGKPIRYLESVGPVPEEGK